jgi:hypothetical protein
MADFVLKDGGDPNIADKDRNSGSNVSPISISCGGRHDVSVNGVNFFFKEAKV